LSWGAIIPTSSCAAKSPEMLAGLRQLSRLQASFQGRHMTLHDRGPARVWRYGKKFGPPSWREYMMNSRLDGFVGDLPHIPHAVDRQIVRGMGPVVDRTEVEGIRARMMSRQLAHDHAKKVRIARRRGFGLVTRSWPCASFRCRAGSKSLSGKSGHQPADNPTN